MNIYFILTFVPMQRRECRSEGLKSENFSPFFLQFLQFFLMFQLHSRVLIN